MILLVIPKYRVSRYYPQEYRQPRIHTVKLCIMHGTLNKESPVRCFHLRDSSKTAATYSPTVTQYHRRDQA